MSSLLLRVLKKSQVDIIMNLKRLDLDLWTMSQIKLPQIVGQRRFLTAQDIQDASDQFEILNPEEYITEINSSGKMDIELRVGIGKGYVPSEDNDKPNLPLGTLSIDSIFNPVTNVTFNVQPVPGAKEPIEILSLDVATDGSITVKDAVSYSATYFREHLKFVEVISNPSVLGNTDGVSDETMALRKLLIKLLMRWSYQYEAIIACKLRE